MNIVPNTPIGGAVILPLVTPTFTVAETAAPDVNGRSWIVTTLGGTQTGVNTHSISNPFQISVWVPKVPAQAVALDSQGKRTRNSPRNEYRIVVRKGTSTVTNQPTENMVVDVAIRVPAGAETNDYPNVVAGLSAAIGFIFDEAAGIGLMTKSGSS